MRHRLFSLLLALALLLSLLPQAAISAGAENGLPELNNLKVSSGGLVTWDAYPGASSYYISAGACWEGFWIEAVTHPRLDFAALLAENYAPSGTFMLELWAEDADGYNLACSQISWTYTNGLTPLSAPTNLRWDGYTAKWDPVEGATNGYTVVLYYADEDWPLVSDNVQDAEKDFSWYTTNQDCEYVFRVSANACPNGARSVDSLPSPAIHGRFLYGDITLSITDEGVLQWPPYLDTEGNYAVWYYLYQNSGNPAELPSGYFRDTSINLKKLLGYIDAPAGDYRYSLAAENGESLRVSKESNEVSYSYTPDAGATCVKLLGWSVNNGWPNEVQLEGMPIGSDEQFSVPTNRGALEFRIVTDRHYRVSAVKLEYGGELYDDPALVDVYIDANGDATVWVEPPAQDFKLVIEQETIYDPLSAAAITYNTEAGQHAYQYSLTDGSDQFYGQVTNVLDDEGWTYGWLLPGKHYTVTFRVWASGYYCFTDDAVLTVNGVPAKDLRVQDESGELYGTLEFDVPAADSVTLVKNDATVPQMGLTVDANGVAHWNAVAGASSYYLYSDGMDSRSLPSTERTLDFAAALAEQNAPAGWTVLCVEAFDAENHSLAYDCAPYHHNGLTRLPAPTGLHWDGTVACWDAVDGAGDYFVELFRTGDYNRVAYRRVSEPCADLAFWLELQARDYVFCVTAYSNEETVANSVRSAFSEARPGRFTLGPITLTLSGDTASWPEYVDTEGNPADQYYLCINSDYDYYSFNLHTLQVNLRQFLEMMDAPDGDYLVYLRAENSEGVTVSDTSNEEVFHYTADPGRVTVPLNGWTYGGDDYAGVDEVYVNGMYLWSYDTLTMNVGETAKLELRPCERYEIRQLWLRYGGEDHECALTQKANGDYEASFTVPDQEFTLVLSTHWNLLEIPAVECSFDQTPGAVLAMTGITVPEDVDYTAYITGISGPHGGGNCVLRAGAEYTVTLSFYAEYGYCFPNGTTVTANGNPSAVDSDRDALTYLSASYTFRATTTVAEIPVRGVIIPTPGKAPTLNCSEAEGDAVVFDSERSGWYAVNGEDLTPLGDDAVFAEGGVYALRLVYTHAPYCPWAETVAASLKLDGAALNRVDRVTVVDAEEDSKAVEIVFLPIPADEPIARVDVTVEKPVGDMHPVMSAEVAPDAPYTVEFRGWFHCEDSDDALTETDTFQTGKTYAARVRVTPKPGFCFDETTVFFLCGDPIYRQYAEDPGTIEGRWVAAEQRPEVTDNTPFTDVVEGKFYYDAVLWAVAHEPQITNGTDATHFSPDATCTRGQVVTFLWRAKGCPEPTKTDSPFTDVTGGFYYKAVLWAVENEITNGTSATTFGPNDGCTRGQVVTFLWRTEGKPEPTTENNPFEDVTGGFYYKAVLWAVENGITAGMDTTHFAPANTCTRGQIVTFLYRDMMKE